MAHTLYSITDNFRKQPPIEKLLYVSCASYGDDWISLFHSHSFSELLYVTHGEGTFCCNDERIPLKPNSLMIINPNIRHTETSSTSNPLTYIVLGIDNLQFEAPKGSPSNNFYVFNMQREQHLLLPLLHSMLDEVKHRNQSYEQICQHFLSSLLLRITRITGAAFILFTHERSNWECAFVKQYLDANYHKDISLTLLAELTHLNKYYLSHIFSEAYGISPINYLLERRIMNSKNLLRGSDYSVTEIAQMTGFSSSNYFSQYFKKQTGMTPSKYKSRHPR